MTTLTQYLEAHAGEGSERRDVAALIERLAEAAGALQRLISTGATGDAGAATGADGDPNGGGDIQKVLDREADRLFLAAARAAPVAFYGSEEQDEAVPLREGASLAMAIDPLDGSSNIETNVSIGTIFSVLPVTDAHRADPAGVFRQPGRAQLAAGFFVYGPRLMLVLTLGQGTHAFGWSPETGAFTRMGPLHIPPVAKEYSINASNARHWEDPVRLYVEQCQEGADGPRGRDFNMRWVASMVADAYRIFVRGGIYIYTGDRRKGYDKGRIRLVYEANPVGFCAEQAGGAASDGVRPILDLVPEGLHQRTPVVFGSREEVLAFAAVMTDPASLSEVSPLFGQRPIGGI
ncbi:class 1 fructose-bisphosphatase [Aureimonas flava]|uniref:Fructose-1,6-bisphosphatase class 1 n=1 Tax=Aureimonas flava TaxID=2320271 RepID=A0A3A1WR62_9HYPH|nr:class 1 fructose-bisphosphatase [Aureimonas flava]RIX99628.1 class 1 fructose-bisphosphatase [Aureimonas flava]